MSLKNKTLALAAWWGWMPFVYGLIWVVNHLLFGGMHWNQDLDQFMLANVWSGGGWFWIWVAIGALGSAAFIILESEEYDTGGYWGRTDTRRVMSKHSGVRYFAVVAAILMVVASVQAFRVSWDNDKDFARYYNRSTTFFVPDTKHVPVSMERLASGATQSSGRCDLISSSDVAGCIKQGTLDMSGWEPRIGSLDGARFALTRSTGDKQKVSLNADTMAYLNEWHGQAPRWSGVLDGKDLQQPLGGVSEWEGQGNAIQCTFEGNYAINKAFAGSRMNSLKNLLAEKYSALRFSMSDVWGYCDGKEPIVVVPMTKQITYKDRTVDTNGGLVTVRGDHGKTKLTYFASAKPGEFPGPVYPASLVVTQRVQTEWAAGRQNRDRNGFGFEPAKSAAQAGNVSEYLLRNKATGRLEWVTPLTLRKSSSELFVAYAISPADTMSTNKLNKLDVYVLADNDPRRINIDNLEADASNYLTNNVGTFKSNGGKLVEFTPVDGDLWRAFGEINGRVVYRLDISASNTIAPKLVSLSPDSEQPTATPGEAGNVACGKPLNGLSQSQLVKCLKQVADELDARDKSASGN